MAALRSTDCHELKREVTLPTRVEAGAKDRLPQAPPQEMDVGLAMAAPQRGASRKRGKDNPGFLEQVEN